MDNVSTRDNRACPNVKRSIIVMYFIEHKSTSTNTITIVIYTKITQKPMWD